MQNLDTMYRVNLRENRMEGVGGGPKAPVGNRSARRAPVGNLIIDLESRWYRVGNAGGGSEDRHATREVLSLPVLAE